MRVELPCDRGRAWYEEAPVRLTFYYQAENNNELCKVLIAKGGSSLLLGTPQPRGQELWLQKSVSRASLEAHGVYPPERLLVTSLAEQRSQTGWRPVSEGKPFVRDPLLTRVLRAGGWVWRNAEPGVELCHPWSVGQPLPCCAFFCFCAPGSNGVRLWLDEQGGITFPRNFRW